VHAPVVSAISMMLTVSLLVQVEYTLLRQIRVLPARAGRVGVPLTQTEANRPAGRGAPPILSRDVASSRKVDVRHVTV